MARKAVPNGNGRRLVTQQSLNSVIKSVCDIMRRSNCAGALQYVPELTWILFLRILDEREAREAQTAEAVGAEFTPSLRRPFRWRDWAAPDGPKRQALQAGTLGAFFGFLNGELLRYLKGLRDRPRATGRRKVISEIMSGVERTRIDTERNFLDVLDRVHVGPAGTGNRIKLLHNALGAVNAVAVAESLALCDAVGVDPRTYYEIVKNGGGMAYSTYFDRRVVRVVEGNYDPTFTLDLMLKDVTLATEMAGDLLSKLPILRETLAAYMEGQRRGSGPEDFSAVTHVIEGRLGHRLFESTP